jgi:hypothetical protein
MSGKPRPDMICSGGLFIRHHLQQHFLGSTRYYFCKPVWKLLATVTFLGPLLPPIVLFLPSIVRIVSYDIYGAALCASTPHCRPALRIAKPSSLFFAMMEEAMLLTLRNSVERATFHRIPSMLVFWMSTLSVSQSMVSMFVCCIFSLLLDAPNLLAFLGSKSTRETTKENFSAALEDYVTSLKQAMAQEMLQDSVIAIHQEQ